jgi:hypothetical protein
MQRRRLVGGGHAVEVKLVDAIGRLELAVKATNGPGIDRTPTRLRWVRSWFLIVAASTASSSTGVSAHFVFTTVKVRRSSSA